jgi:hypothetical protein
LQVIHELKVFLLVGRTLVLPSAGSSLEVNMIKTLEFSQRGSVIRQRVDLLFPALPRTVARLMEHWWAECKGGKPITRQEQKAASKQGRPTHRAMPVRFHVMVLALVHWQHELTSSIVELG